MGQIRIKGSATVRRVRGIAREDAAGSALVGDGTDRREGANEGIVPISQLELNRVSPASLAGVDYGRVIDRGEETAKGVGHRVACAGAVGITSDIGRRARDALCAYTAGIEGSGRGASGEGFHGDRRNQDAPRGAHAGAHPTGFASGPGRGR